MSSILSEVELYCFQVLLSEASSPAVKVWALNELKSADAASTNAVLKKVIEAIEAFLAAPAPPA